MTVSQPSRATALILQTTLTISLTNFIRFTVESELDPAEPGIEPCVVNTVCNFCSAGDGNCDQLKNSFSENSTQHTEVTKYASEVMFECGLGREFRIPLPSNASSNATAANEPKVYGNDSFAKINMTCGWDGNWTHEANGAECVCEYLPEHPERPFFGTQRLIMKKGLPASTLRFLPRTRTSSDTTTSAPPSRSATPLYTPASRNTTSASTRRCTTSPLSATATGRGSCPTCGRSATIPRVGIVYLTSSNSKITSQQFIFSQSAFASTRPTFLSTAGRRRGTRLRSPAAAPPTTTGPRTPAKREGDS